MWEWRWKSYWLPACMPWDVNLSRETRQLWSLVIFPTRWSFAQTWLLLNLPSRRLLLTVLMRPPALMPFGYLGHRAHLSVLGHQCSFLYHMALQQFLQPHSYLFYIYNLMVNFFLSWGEINAIDQQILCCKRGLSSTPLLYFHVYSRITYHITLVCTRYCVRG